MAGLNKCAFIGNLGRDPELRKTNNGTSIATFSIAINEKWTDSSGNKQERTEWVNITMWKKLADLAVKFLTKGSQVYVEGSLKTESWDDKDGSKKYRTYVLGKSMQFLGGAKKEGNQQQQQSQQEPPPEQNYSQGPDLPF